MSASEDSFIAGHIADLQGMFAKFAHAWGGELAALLRTSVDLHVSSCGQCTEKIPSDPTYIFGLGVRAGAAARELATLELEPAAAHWLVDAMMGGGQSQPRNGPLTDIDRRVIEPVIQRAADALGPCIDPAGKTPLAAEAPSLAGDAAVACQLRLQQSGGSARVSLTKDAAIQCLRALGFAPPVLLSAYLEETISPQELSSLDIGDILASDTPPDGEVIVELAGRGRYAATLGQLNGHRALTIVRKLDS